MIPATPLMPHWHMNDYSADQLQDIDAHINRLVSAGVGYRLHYCLDVALRAKIIAETKVEMLKDVPVVTRSPLFVSPFLQEDQLRAYEAWVGAKS